MNYSLCAAVKPTKDGAAYAFCVYNHRGERVYRTKGLIPASEMAAGEDAALSAEMSAARKAVFYFSSFIRSRYYDEHFATILDEDHLDVRTLSPLPRPRDLAESAPLFPFADALEEYFARPTITFTPVPAGAPDMKETLSFLADA
ncbi:MAG: hypothetical protein IJR89_04355 [Clostridia bacterium]|nr:hypothetical protein [Clostridia bacterium]